MSAFGFTPIEIGHIKGAFFAKKRPRDRSHWTHLVARADPLIERALAEQRRLVLDEGAEWDNRKNGVAGLVRGASMESSE